MTALRRPSYAFAKRHGIVALESLDNGHIQVAYRPGLNHRSLLELRRYLDRPLSPKPVSAENFENLLQGFYESDANGAAQMMEGMGEELDLDQVAQQLNREPEDLLENADEAPIIRLINALLTEAIKEALKRAGKEITYIGAGEIDDRKIVTGSIISYISIATGNSNAQRKRSNRSIGNLRWSGRI